MQGKYCNWLNNMELLLFKENNFTVKNQKIIICVCVLHTVMRRKLKQEFLVISKAYYELYPDK